MKPELSFAQLKPLMSEALKTLSKRSADVVSRRFGLKTGTPETLESIGNGYKITRERVRQIEEVVLRDLRRQYDTFNMHAQLVAIKDILANYGNVLREDTLFRLASGSPDYNKQNAYLTLLMIISNQLRRYGETAACHTVWTVKDPAYIERAKAVAGTIADHFKKTRKIVAQNALYDLFNTSLTSNKEETLEPHVLLAYVSISKELGKNIFDYWGIADWSEIAPRGVRDKAYLVLKEAGEPRHFREIARLISNAGFDVKKANPNTTHNDLIRDDRFVLVGRGVYALAEWGYTDGTVKDVLVSVLQDAKKPLPKEKIVAKVLESRMVKPNTVLLNLQNSDMFARDKNGHYYLAKEA